MALIEYRIVPERQAEFVAALRRFKSERQRDSTIRWHVWEYVKDPGRVVEGFVFESWIDHQRRHARLPRPTCWIRNCWNAFHIGDQQQIVRQLRRSL